MTKKIPVIRNSDNYVYPIMSRGLNCTMGGTGDNSNKYLKLCIIKAKTPWEVINPLLLITVGNTAFGSYLLNIHIDVGVDASRFRGLYFNAIRINNGNGRLVPSDFYLIKKSSNTKETIFELYVHLRYTWMGIRLSVISLISSINTEVFKISTDRTLYSSLPSNLQVFNATLTSQT